MGRGAVVEHKLHGGQFERSGFALVGAEHAIARCFEALLRPELSVYSVNDPHAAAVDGRLVKFDPIGTDGVQFVDAKIVVVLVPVDSATGMRRISLRFGPISRQRVCGRVGLGGYC